MIPPINHDSRLRSQSNRDQISPEFSFSPIPQPYQPSIPPPSPSHVSSVAPAPAKIPVFQQGEPTSLAGTPTLDGDFNHPPSWPTIGHFHKAIHNIINIKQKSNESIVSIHSFPIVLLIKTINIHSFPKKFPYSFTNKKHIKTINIHSFPMVLLVPGAQFSDTNPERPT